MESGSEAAVYSPLRRMPSDHGIAFLICEKCQDARHKAARDLIVTDPKIKQPTVTRVHFPEVDKSGWSVTFAGALFLFGRE